MSGNDKAALCCTAVLILIAALWVMADSSPGLGSVFGAGLTKTAAPEDVTVLDARVVAALETLEASQYLQFTGPVTFTRRVVFLGPVEFEETVVFRSSVSMMDDEKDRRRCP